MYTGLLHLHNLLRWVILIFLVISIVQSISAKSGKPAAGLKKTSLFLLISTHITFLIGLYQYFAGPSGFKIFQAYSMGEIMKNSALRFWAVEHITGMLIAIILITIGRGKVKKTQYSSATWLFIIALILILATVPWPFREGIGRTLFPGL